MNSTPDTSAPVRPRISWFKRLVFVGLILLGVAILLELVLRIWDPIGIAFFPEAGRYLRNLTYDDRYGYLHTPGYTDTLQGVRVSINRQGFRGPDFADPKPADQRRILVVGDSIVFGWGAPQEAIFPRQLQLMTDRDRQPCEILGLGVVSWNTRMEYEYLKATGFTLEPDAILLVITSNDAEPYRGARCDVDRDRLFEGLPRSDDTYGGLLGAWRWFARNSYLLSTLQYVRLQLHVAPPPPPPDAESIRWKDARLALTGLIEECRKRNIQLAACLYTTEEQVSKPSLMALYRAVLAEYGVSFCTLPADIFKTRAYHNSVVDTHPNAKGHVRIAEEIHERILPVLLSTTNAVPAAAETHPVP